MSERVLHVGEPRAAARWQALEWASCHLAPSLDAAHGDVRVEASPTVVLGTRTPEAPLSHAFDAAVSTLSLPIRVRSAARILYAGSARRAVDLARDLASNAEHDVILQPVSARLRGAGRYPTLTGDLFSENAYPISYLEPTDGVARVLFGLGDDLASRRDALRFSPRHPDLMPDFSQPDDVLRNGQSRFSALSGENDEPELRQHRLDAARTDGTLNAVGGVVSIENQTVYPGVHRDGVRIVTCAMLLRGHPIALAPLLSEMLEALGESPASAPAYRIRFSLDLPTPKEKGEPVLLIEDVEPLARPEPFRPPPPECLLLATRTALGLGQYAGTRDIVYVPRDRFDVARTPEIAAEIARANAWCAERDRRFVLMVAGRLGSTDRSLGVPVRWRDISSASVQVEVALEGFNVEESHGTHFFRELTSGGVGYLHVSLAQPGAEIHWDRLDGLEAAHEGTFVRHVVFGEAPVIWADGMRQRGVIALGGS